MSIKTLMALSASWALLSGCASSPESFGSQFPVTVLQDRVPKSRVLFVDQDGVVAKAIVATLQDLGFQVDFSSRDLNLVTGWRTGGQLGEKVTVTYQRIDKDFVQFRANFSNDGDDISSQAVLYQDFFTNLSKSVFLAKNGIL